MMLGFTQVNAGTGCSISTTSCVNGTIYGKICPGSLPSAAAGTSYVGSNSFQIPNSFQLNTATLGLSFGTVTVNVLKVNASVVGLPRGLQAQFDNGTGQYTPTSATSAGCFQVVGTPCDTAGTYPVSLNFTVKISVAGLITLDLPFPLVNPLPLTLTSTYPVLALTAPFTHLCGSGLGSEVTVHATPGFAVGGNGGYAWTGGSTDDSLLITAAGQYMVTATTSDGACTFNDSITISRLVAQTHADTTICKGSFLKLVATGGDTYSWSPSTYLNSTNTATTVVLRTDTAATMAYQVLVSNGFCSDSVTVNVGTQVCTTGSTCDTCNVVPSGCSGQVPKLCSTFPDVTAGVPYSQSVTFYIPATVTVASLLPIPITIPGLPTTVNIDNAKIVVDSLPAGLDWATDQSGNHNKYVPNLDPSFQYGCLKICGTTCGPIAGNYMSVVAMIELPKQLKDIVKSLKAGPAAALLGNIDTIVPIPLAGNIAVVPGLAVSLTPAGAVTIHPGETATVVCNPGFSSYAWASGSTADSLVVDTTGTYCVTVTDTAGCTQTACKTVTLLEGVENVALSTSLSIYPNPNSGVFGVQFSLKTNESVTAQVFDVTGKAIYSTTFNGTAGNNKLNMDMSGIAKGIYVVKITTAEGTANRKVTLK